MPSRSERISELYYLSKTVKFGSFRLSSHRDNPNLPLSPWYLHYPKEDEPGVRYLPELHGLIGDEFYELCETQSPPVRPKRLAAVPEGAIPLVDAHAQKYPDYPRNLVVFGKIQHSDGRTEFTGPEGEWEESDELLIGDDHTSASRNKLINLEAARRRGFVVRTMVTVVDRQQGGAENMAAQGVNLLSILTADELLSHGLVENHITKGIFDTVQEYRERV